MKWIRKSIFIIPIVVVIVACNVASPISTSTATITPVIPVSSQEANTPTLPSPTITVMPSATKNALDLPEDCINLKSVDFNPIEFNGLLTLFGTSSNHLFDPKANQNLDIDESGNQIFYPGLISPNKKYVLVSTHNNGNNIYFDIRTADRIIRKDIQIPDSWIFGRWLNNEEMAFFSLVPEEYVNIFNPFTGDTKKIRPELPNALVMDFSSLFKIIYYYIDPTLKRVIYGDQDGKLILWDIEARKEIVSLPALVKPNGYLASPVEVFHPFGWTQDGRKFVTPWPISESNQPLANELYVFDMSGELKKLTNLNKEYSFAEIDIPIWSPDGGRIGFALRIGKTDANPRKPDQWLAILDTSTLETKVYCLAIDTSVIWSPDGQRLIINIDGTSRDHESILVDLINQTQTVINTNSMYVYDWLSP